ncbi:MAG: type II toxin-antitoxin system VapC family toxin [Acidobacteria bacterium]|nr:MAG: type II toxin-antitoxin system VapC family toxin [Acidobacteriota bacterium]REK11066.1 MAG: type II toxin-antitoxin system VapC family toxin [Acidobacteriota bacterium]
MRVLLDTHVWLWMQVEPERFSRDTTEEILLDSTVDLLLSAASSWEIAIQHALGKLELPLAPTEYVPSRMASSGVLGLPIEHAHALHVASLPPHHTDPFDRLLVAQAQLESLPILTADAQLAAYDVQLLQP